MSDIGIRVNEDFLQIALLAVGRQRPSAFNFATPGLAKNPAKLCTPIPRPPNGAPRVTTVPHLEVGRRAGLRLLAEYSYQLDNSKIDFRPTSQSDSDFELSTDINVGIGLPKALDDEFLLLPNRASTKRRDVILPFDKLRCASVSFLAAGSARWIADQGKYFFCFFVDQFDFDTAGFSGPSFDLLKQTIVSKLNYDILPGMAFEVSPFSIKVPDSTTRLTFSLEPNSKGAEPLFAGNRMNLSFLLR